MTMPTWISWEPALWIAVVDALLVLGVTFGLPITPEQKGAIDAALAAIAGVMIRTQVTPVAKLMATGPAAGRVPGVPVTAADLEHRIDELWQQRAAIDAQLAQVGALVGPPPAPA
jgi:hypothetical protein